LKRLFTISIVFLFTSPFGNAKHIIFSDSVYENNNSNDPMLILWTFLSDSANILGIVETAARNAVINSSFFPNIPQTLPQHFA